LKKFLSEKMSTKESGTKPSASPEKEPKATEEIEKEFNSKERSLRICSTDSDMM